MCSQTAKAVGAREVIETVRLLPEPPQAPLVVVHEINVVFVGRLSVNTTDVAGLGPLLVTLVVKVRFETVKAGEGRALCTTTRSAFAVKPSN